MRILTDFDGVLTAQDDEAAEVGARLRERVVEALGDAVRSRELIADLEREVRENPAQHGWFTGARCGCYADEDTYVSNVALARALFQRGPAELRTGLARVGISSWEALSSAAFEEGTARYRSTHPTHVLDEALGATEAFLATGAGVVIVSNSATERVEALLAPSGIARSSSVRIRGGARKFALTGDRPASVPETLDFGGRPVHLRRGHYWDILRDERPDVVVGDVLSLDLALPAALRESGELDRPRIVLKRHPRTPRWVIEACSARGIDIVDSIAQVPPLLRT